MTDEVLTWPLDEHLRHGEELIEQLPPIKAEHARVCFHLTPTTCDDSEPWSEEASFCRRAKPLFEASGLPLNVDYVGGTSGIEAWENVIPSVPWLHARLPVLIEIASKGGLDFDGWSFEPSQPRDASYFSCGPTLDVVNRNSPEGQMAFDDLIASIETSKTAED